MSQYPADIPVGLVAVLMDAAQNHDVQAFNYDMSVYSFPQIWGSTSLGFGGMGGAMVTTAQTTILMRGNNALVYFGSRYAYTMNHTEALECVRALRCPPVYEYVKKEEK